MNPMMPQDRRRRRLVVATIAAGAVAACSGSEKNGSPYEAELRWAAMAAAWENLLVTAYETVEKRAGNGAPALAAYLQATKEHHRAHAKAWNDLLGRAGAPIVTGTPVRMASATIKDAEGATTETAIAQLLKDLEVVSADTYTATIGRVQNLGLVAMASQVQPVEHMHAATLRSLLGEPLEPAARVDARRAVDLDSFTA